ncbi:alpha/beta fold hydrolase [Butyrivibrio sp. WCD3002]|uniref:alpha/beta fold hydrolase n=1 Tax=Butyrivibrio sp. WCD3002 TaxID=1280676 RepID=UPI000427DDC4|nr:alpha/beta hydrolase [Butyrivibrio sp. WCD3002]
MNMTEKTYITDKGTIHYWTCETPEKDKPELVFLPGLTADHRLYEKQLEHFAGKYRIFVWDAPGHASSYPFEMTFNLEDKAKWLDEILELENFKEPVFIGQSMGGYLSQAYAQLFPDKMKGFISIDSAPLGKGYYRAWELWVLFRMEPVYLKYPWKLLLKQGSDGVATSDYGRSLMRSMMMTYDGDQPRYALLAGQGYRIVAEAISADLPYELKCPTQLICGTKDQAGYCKRYNKAWHKKTGLPITWIEGAGHNSNTDAPDEINKLISDFVEKLDASKP